MEEIKQALIEAGVVTKDEDMMHLTEPGALYEESARPELEYIARELVEPFTHYDIQTVVGLEGLEGKRGQLARAATLALNRVPRNVITCTALAEKSLFKDGVIIQNHWHTLIKGERVLVIHDFIRDASEIHLIQKLIAAVEEGGGIPVGIGVIACSGLYFDEFFKSVEYRRQLLNGWHIKM